MTLPYEHAELVVFAVGAGLTAACVAWLIVLTVCTIARPRWRRTTICKGNWIAAPLSLVAALCIMLGWPMTAQLHKDRDRDLTQIIERRYAKTIRRVTYAHSQGHTNIRYVSASGRKCSAQVTKADNVGWVIVPESVQCRYPDGSYPGADPNPAPRKVG